MISRSALPAAAPGRRRRGRLLALTVVALLAWAMALPAAVGASTGASNDSAYLSPKVTAVDSTGDQVEVSVLWPGADPSSVGLQVAGETLSPTIARSWELGHEREIVFVIDPDFRITSSETGSQYAPALNELVPILDGLRDLSIGAVVAGSTATTGARLVGVEDRSSAAAAAAASAAEPSGNRNLQDALEKAAAMFLAEPVAPWIPDEDELLAEGEQVVTRTVVLLSGNPLANAVSVGPAGSALTQAGAQLIVVPLADTQVDPGLAQLAVRTGGVVLPAGTEVADAAALASYRQVISAAVPAAGERRDAILTLDGETISFSYPDDVITSNPLQLGPRVFGDPVDPGIFASPLVLYGSIALAFLAVAVIIWAIGSSVYGETSLDSLLARYSGEESELADEEVQDLIVQTALLKRAVEATENIAAQRGFLGRAEVMLERANVPMRAGEALFFAAAAALLAAGGVWAVTQNPLIAVPVLIFVPVLGYYVLQFLAARRFKAFQEQLPDTLTLLAGTLRAGYSLPQGFQAVSNEVGDPMGVELRRAMTETQLGRELEDALANLAVRMSSDDFSWVVMALGIQREVGGNLAEVLVSVAETMIQRERLRREVSALTAEGRVSAGMLSLMPPALGVVMWFLNPEYIGVLFSETAGMILLGAGVLSATIGLFWMRKVITVEA